MFFLSHYKNDHRNLSIDLLRGLSILIVVFMHFTFVTLPPNIAVSWVPMSWEVFIATARNGYYGVSVFFAISGFLITSKLLLQTKDTPKNINLSIFYLFRFSRIIPGLVVISCVNILFYSLHVDDFYSIEQHVDMKEALFSLFTFRFNYFYVYDNGKFLTTWAILWSIAVEEMFYLLYPLMLIFLRKNFFILIALFAIIFYGPYYRMNGTLDTTYLYFGCFDQLALGCIVAFSINTRWYKKIPVLYCRLITLLGFSLMVYVYAIDNVNDNYTWGPTFMALGGSMYLFGQSKAKIVSSFLKLQMLKKISLILVFPICILGILSYEIYLVHMVIFVFIKSFFIKYFLLPNKLLYFFPSFFLTLVILTTICGLLYFYLLEPVREKLRKIF